MGSNTENEVNKETESLFCFFSGHFFHFLPLAFLYKIFRFFIDSAVSLSPALPPGVGIRAKKKAALRRRDVVAHAFRFEA